MDTDVPAFFEPLDQHLQAIFRKFVAEPCSFLVVVTEVSCGVIFFDTAPEDTVKDSNED